MSRTTPRMLVMLIALLMVLTLAPTASANSQTTKAIADCLKPPCTTQEIMAICDGIGKDLRDIQQDPATAVQDDLGASQRFLVKVVLAEVGDALLGADVSGAAFPSEKGRAGSSDAAASKECQKGVHYATHA